MGKIGVGAYSFIVRIRSRGVIYKDEDGVFMFDFIGGGSDDNDVVLGMCG